jgi:Reverse transcriptase (RNA-dependent DNA polymerase)
MLIQQILSKSQHNSKRFLKRSYCSNTQKNNATEINEFRPINLLNCDYKLFAKILANRITINLDQILETGQTACVTDSSCVQNVTKLRNLIAKAANNRRMKFGVFSLDLNKAFDRVKHTYLLKTLVKFGFPENFINVIKNLY